jgi:hypothetical protein
MRRFLAIVGSALAARALGTLTLVLGFFGLIRSLLRR